MQIEIPSSVPFVESGKFFFPIIKIVIKFGNSKMNGG